MSLTPHFTLKEFTDSQNAARLGLDNTPNVSELANIRRVAEVLEQVRALYGRPLVISSGFRCQAVNDITPGSSKTSAHRFGLAADFTIPSVPVIEVCRKIRDSGIKYDQLIFEGSWVHIGLSAGGPRQQNLTAHFGSKKTTYTEGF